MKPQILLIHGYNVWDKGDTTVGELRGYYAAEGCPYHILKYGHFGLWDTRTKNDDVARQATAFITNADRPVIVVGHSNGAAIIYLAMKLYGAKPAHVVLVNPALVRNLRMPEQCPSVDIWHSPSDAPVKWAKWLPSTQMRPWGDMGAYGPSYTDDPRLNVINKEHEFAVSSKEHSDAFRTELLSFFGPLIVNESLRGFRE